MTENERWKDRVDDAIEKLREDVSSLKEAQKWAIGAVGALLWVIGFFSDKLRHMLGG